jgi:hypothetical protein
LKLFCNKNIYKQNKIKIKMEKGTLLKTTAVALLISAVVLFIKDTDNTPISFIMSLAATLILIAGKK